MSKNIDYLEINKVKVPMVYLKSDRFPRVDIQVVFKNSGKNVNNKIGLSYLVSKVLGSGTMKKDENEFYEALESRAVSFQVYSGYENMTFSLSSLSEETAVGLKALKSVFAKPRLSKKNLSKMQKYVKGVILEKQNNLGYRASAGLNTILFKGSKFANPLLGSLKSVDSITLSDIKKFIKSHITLNNAIIVIAGDYKDKDIKKLTSALSVLDKGKKEKEKTFPIKDRNETIREDVPSTEQAFIEFGSSFNLKISDEDTYKARIAHFILGSGGFGSRLMDEIRVKKGLAYSIHADNQIEKSFSAFRGALQTKLENEEEAIKIVRQTILKFTQKGVTQKELTSAKKFILGSYPLQNELLAQRIGRMFSDFVNNKNANAYEEDLKKIKSLSLRDLNIFIKKHTEINNLSFYIVTKKRNEIK